jgi:hypothetical protein
MSSSTTLVLMVVPSFEVDVEVIVGSPPHRGAIEHVIRVLSGPSASGMPKRRRRSMCDPVSSSFTIDVDERAHPGVVRVWITEAASD